MSACIHNIWNNQPVNLSNIHYLNRRNNCAWFNISDEHDLLIPDCCDREDDLLSLGHTEENVL